MCRDGHHDRLGPQILSVAQRVQHGKHALRALAVRDGIFVHLHVSQSDPDQLHKILDHDLVLHRERDRRRCWMHWMRCAHAAQVSALSTSCGALVPHAHLSGSTAGGGRGHSGLRQQIHVHTLVDRLQDADIVAFEVLDRLDEHTFRVVTRELVEGAVEPVVLIAVRNVDL